MTQRAIYPSDTADLATPPPPIAKGGRRRIALFNVKYSPNLGDGIIAECLEAALVKASPALQPHPIDLAGRERFEPSQGGRRGAILKVLEAMPRRLRSIVVPLALQALVEKRLAPRWEERLSTCDAAIIGGGALIADADQNFPIKLSKALTLCGARGIRVAIAHVGVTDGWSRPGLQRFRKALRGVNLASASFRDPVSVRLWEELFHLPGMVEPELALDPGLLARDTYGRPPERNGRGRIRAGAGRIGVCLTDPMVLRLHGEGRQDTDFTTEWLVALIRSLCRAGHEVVLFTNGSPEDESYKSNIAAELESEARVHVAPAFRKPGELALFIAELDGVVAHRLHACIVAYSYRVPAIGLAWDRKLDRFFALTGRNAYVVAPQQDSPPDVAALVRKAVNDPPEEAQHRRILLECEQSIERLATRLNAACATR